MESSDTPPSDVPSLMFPELTAREREVAEHLLEGRSCTQIGIALGVSVKTIDTHRQHVLKKLEVRNAVELLRLAIRRGYTVRP